MEAKDLLQSVGLRDMIKRHEGLVLHPYKCPTGHWSIGYGHNLEAHGEPVPESIAAEQAEDYFDRDLGKAIEDCYMSIPDMAGYDEVRAAVLVDMAYNMGIWALVKFVKMLRAFHEKNWNKAAFELLDSRYADQVGARARELAQMILTGKWQQKEKENA